MDIKISGVTFEILKAALDAGSRGSAVHPREDGGGHLGDTSGAQPYAPRITSIKIDPEKIGAVIGKGGETIRALSEEYEAQIDVDDDGTVLVNATNGELGDACIEEIQHDDEGGRARRRVHGQGREDHHLRRLRGVDQGNRRPASHLEPQAG